MRNDGDNSEQTFRATLRLVGPLKRSTFQKEQPDSAEELLSDILHWSWSLRMQADRLKQDGISELKKWGSDSSYIARKAFSRTSCDEHLIMVVATNLDRALNRVPKKQKNILSIDPNSRRALKLLRNIYEHWDEMRKELRQNNDDPKKSLGILKKEYPDADPWSITIIPENDDILLAGVVSINTLITELRQLEARVLRTERARKRGIVKGK